MKLVTMKLVTTKGALYAALESASALANCTSKAMLTFENGRLVITACSDNNNAVRTTCEVKGELPSCTVEVRRLCAAVKPSNVADRATPVEITAIPEVSANYCTLAVAADGVAVGVQALLAASKVELFEPFDTKHKTRKWTHDAEKLRDALAWVLPACSRDTCTELNNVLFAKGRLVATDGHRLHTQILSGFAGAASAWLAQPVAAVLLRCLSQGEVTLEHCGDVLRVSGPGWIVASRVGTKRLPWQEVIPAKTDGDKLVTVDRSKFVAVLARMRLRSAGAFFTFGADVLRLRQCEPYSPETNRRVQVDLPAEIKGLTAEDEIGYNPVYLREVLAVTDKRVTLRWQGVSFNEASPLRLDLAGGRMAVIMPMRK